MKPPLVDESAVDLLWIPLGAGDASPLVGWSGRAFEAIAARRHHRPRRDLYHSALEVRLDGNRFVIEMTPAWSGPPGDRGVVVTGAVGLAWLGRSRMFRYEVRRWANGVIPDAAEAVGGGHRISHDRRHAEAVLDLAAGFPALTWGRDELATGDMWNSNSLISWLLVRAGVDTEDLRPPPGGRAPGWDAGLLVARREMAGPSR
jgi:hypothetical protein